MSKKKSSLSAEERHLFRAEVGDVKRLRHDKVVLEPLQPKVISPRFVEVSHSIHDQFSDEYEPQVSEAGDALAFFRPGIQKTVLRKLRQGHFRLDASLDLHGYTVAEARSALNSFLYECRQDQSRYVCIVHGKGYGSQDRGPVLKNKVNSWLRQCDDVLAFYSAQPKHGGTGAVYTLLKKFT